MHPGLYEHWWHTESARIHERAAKAEAARSSKHRKTRRSSSRPVWPSLTVKPALRLARRVSAGVLAFGNRVPRRLGVPVSATVAGKRG